MKIRPLVILVALTALVTLTACPSAMDLYRDYAKWNVKNGANENITFIVYKYKTGEFGGYIPSEYNIKPDSVRVIRFMYGLITFSRMYDKNDDNDSVQLISPDGTTVLKTWRSLEKDEPGRQFFNEKYWIKEGKHRGDRVDSTWTFVVLPEDFQ